MANYKESLVPRRRPGSLSWLCVGLFGVGVINLGAALRTTQNIAMYQALDVSFSPPLHIVASLGWGISFVWIAWQLWQLHIGASRIALNIISVYGAFSVLWGRLFVHSDHAIQRWPFASLATILIVVLLIWYLTRPRIRILFQNKMPDVVASETTPS